MEFDTPAAPLHNLPGPSSSSISGVDPLEGVFTMDDFLAQHGPAQEAEDAAREAKKQHAQKKIKPNFPTSSPVPVPVSNRSSTNTIALHEKYQFYGIDRPDFNFTGSSHEGWGVKTTFLGEELDAGGKFASKQEAKEAICEKALKIIVEKEKEGTLKKPEKTKEPKGVFQQPKKEKEPGVNWTGQLLEFQRATNAPQANYSDFVFGNSFSCVVTIKGHASSYGGETIFFSSKRAARQHAAACAVQYFKDQGLWPTGIDAVGGIKKKKTAAIDTPTLIGTHTPRSPTSTTPSTSTAVAGTGSYAQQAAQLSALLSLSTPEWRFSPKDPSAPGFQTVACYFKASSPHDGPIGEVRHIFGKKKAKEECARLTVEYLLGVKERRLNYGRRMMAGVEGGEDIAGVAVRGGFEGEERGGSVRDGDAGEEESDAEFEDAVEELECEA